MKTKSFLLGAASLMLAASCSNDEVVNVAPQSGAIGFSSFVNNSTRADATYESIKDLKVWGVTSRGTEVPATEIFDGQIVEKGAVTTPGLWTYSPLRYWITDNDYSFAAVAPASVVGVAEENKLVTVSQPTTFPEGWSEAGLTLAFDNEAAKAENDILYATAKVVKAESTHGEVSLNLKHMLSRVRFQFDLSGFPSDQTIEISDVKILDATSKATITKAEATGTWTPAVPENNTFEVPFTVPEGNNNKVSVVTEHKYLIPLTGKTEYHVIFTVKLMKGANMLAKYEHKGILIEGTQDQYAGVALGGIEYKNNCSYTLKATLDPKTIDPQKELLPIKFSVDVTGWDDDPDNTTWSQNPEFVKK